MYWQLKQKCIKNQSKLIFLSKKKTKQTKTEKDFLFPRLKNPLTNGLCVGGDNWIRIDLHMSIM